MTRSRDSQQPRKVAHQWSRGSSLTTSSPTLPRRRSGMPPNGSGNSWTGWTGCSRSTRSSARSTRRSSTRSAPRSSALGGECRFIPCPRLPTKEHQQPLVLFCFKLQVYVKLLKTLDNFNKVCYNISTSKRRKGETMTTAKTTAKNTVRIVALITGLFFFATPLGSSIRKKRRQDREVERNLKDCEQW